MFSGIGGFELGIEKAREQEPKREGTIRADILKRRDISELRGWRGKPEQKERHRLQQWVCIGFSEIDKYATQTYLKHFPTHKNYGDAAKIVPEELPDFDMLCGGFPCQAFSIAGKRMGFEDTRGTLFFDIARIAKVKRPQILFLENVKGLLNHDNGRTFTTILATLDELGYNAEWEVLNSKHFGVPQNRERVFIIGHLRGTSSRQVFPLGKGSKMDNGEQGQIKMTQNSGKEIARVYDVEGLAPTLKGKTGGWQEPKIVIPVLTPNRPEKRQNGRRFKEDGEPSFTLTGQDVHGVMTVSNAVTPDAYLASGKRKRVDGKAVLTSMHERRIRRLTPTECERLQGFPDGWTEGVSDTQRYKQLGNAVTVNVIESIVRCII